MRSTTPVTTAPTFTSGPAATAAIVPGCAPSGASARPIFFA
jgi:hypothetical protein